MQIETRRRVWFEAAPVAVWAALICVEEYRTWWPWLHGLDAAGFEPGSVWQCTVQPPVPYQLRFTLRLEDVEPERSASASIDGDIAGRARIDLMPVDGGTELTLVAKLRPVRGLLVAVSTVAAPVARWAHDWVLETGVRQFGDRALDER